MTFQLTITVTADDIGPAVAHLSQVYGSVFVVSDDRQAEIEGTDDEVDPEMLLAILQGASERMGHAPDAQRQLSELVEALQAPPGERTTPLGAATLLREAQASVALDGETQSVDEAPPHGIERPSLPDTDLPPRPNSTRRHSGDKPNTVQREEALRIIRDGAACPTCGAKVGEWCRGVKTGSYGSNHVHEARINLIYGQPPR